MWRVGAVLGLRLSVGLYPGTGPAIRDHIQSPMVGELIALAHMRWRRTPEVAVYRPVRGVIDLALDAIDEPTLACEAQSQLRLIESRFRRRRPRPTHWLWRAEWRAKTAGRLPVRSAGCCSFGRRSEREWSSPSTPS